MAEKIEAMLPSGEWITLAEWTAQPFDGQGPGKPEGESARAWIDRWALRIEGGSAPLPNSGMVDLGQFYAVRAA